MGVETAVLGGGALVAGAFGQHEANKKQKKNQGLLTRYVQDYEATQLGNLEQGVGEQERLLLKSLRIQDKGSEDAINRAEIEGGKAIEREGAAAGGQARAALGGSGLLGGSADANLRLAVGRNKSLGYATLGERVAAMRQNLEQQRAVGLQKVGALKGYRAQGRNQILANSANMLAGFHGSQQYSSQGVDLSGLGMLMGYASTKGGGGGGSSMPYGTAQQWGADY